MDLDNRDRKYSLIFRSLEFLGCAVCLIIGILLIYNQMYYPKELDSKLTYPTLFVLFTPSIIFTIVTLYDLVYYFRKQPVYSHGTWWPFATLAMILFFAAAGLIIFTRKRFENIAINVALAFTIITGIIFLFDILLLLYGYYTKYTRPVPQEDRTTREYYDQKIAPTVAPRRSIRTMQRPQEFEKCPPCRYVCEKATSYHDVPEKKKSSAMIQRRESKRPFGDERILYPSVHVTQPPARTEEKYTQSSKTSVCNCQTRGGDCHQCKWIKYLLEAQQRSENKTRERRGSNVHPTKYVPYESGSSSPVSSGNHLKPVVYQEQLTVTKPSKKVSSQYKEVENKQSIHNLQNTELVKTYIQQQNIPPRISKTEASKQNSIHSTRKPSYKQVTSVIVHRNPSTVKENKYTQSSLISNSKDQQTSTSQIGFQYNRPRRTSSQEEVAIQVIDYEQTCLQKISEVSLETTVTKSDANNPGKPKIYVSDTADSDNSKQIPSKRSSPAPCKRTQYSNDTKCACAHKPALDDAICVHCLRQWKKYQSTKSSDNEPSPPITNEKGHGLSKQPGFTEQISQGVQIRQASALFQYISAKSNTSPSTSELYPAVSVQPQQPNPRKPQAACRNVRGTSRSEPPKILCMCKENEDPCCKMHGTKNKLISLPTSATRHNDGKNVPKVNHSTQIARKDRYKTSP